MNIKTLIFATLLALLAGSVLLLIDKEYIIIRTPNFANQLGSHSGNSRAEKKEISFYFWNKNWVLEKKQCIWLTDSTQDALEQNKIKQTNLKQLVVTWLATLQAELGVPTADIAVQATTLNPSGYVAYISFSSYPLLPTPRQARRQPEEAESKGGGEREEDSNQDQESARSSAGENGQNSNPQSYSIHAKLMWVEGLLKTIHSSGLALQSVHFLHNHQPLQDPHLDFTNPWPVHGFVNK